MNNMDELNKRLQYNQNPANCCRAGGYSKHGLHINYGLPCVTGAIYWEDGSVTKATNCVYCGKENNE